MATFWSTYENLLNFFFQHLVTLVEKENLDRRESENVGWPQASERPLVSIGYWISLPAFHFKPPMLNLSVEVKAMIHLKMMDRFDLGRDPNPPLAYTVMTTAWLTTVPRLCCTTKAVSNKITFVMGSGSTGRAVASDTSGPQLKSRYNKHIYC